MAQPNRAVKEWLLRASPQAMQDWLLSRYPNLRKAAPPGRQLLFEHYYGDIKVHVDTRYRAERMMWSGVCEPRFVHFLESQELPGKTCFDVGANVGALTLVMAKLVQPGGRVIAFEPGPPNVEGLRANLALNPQLAECVEVVEAGLGSESGELWWSEEQGNPGNAMLGTQGSHRVPVETIDDVARERGIDRVDLIKIDVEGMEENVLRGARDTLMRSRPVLYFETRDRRTGQSPLEELLNQAGYLYYVLDTAGRTMPAPHAHASDYTVAIAQ